MAETFTRYDPAAALDSIEAIEVFLVDAFETGDADHIAAAFGDVVRAKGIPPCPDVAGLSCEQLSRSLNETGNPRLETILAILKGLGLRLTVASAVFPEKVQSSVPEVGHAPVFMNK